MEPKWSYANRPRESVNWYEALAFTRWLSRQLGFNLALPTEEQWEKAARGHDANLFPWGNQYRSGYANVDETEQEEGQYFLQETSAVGLYPQGGSAYQVADMAGNVWEWCLNKFEKPEQITPDNSNTSRVMRGGSWLFDSDTARSTFRSGNFPDLRHNFIGFRVACASPFGD